MNEWVLIGGMMAVTFGIRYSMFGLSEKLVFPPLLERALQYVPPAILTAIIVPAIFISEQNQWDFTLTNARLIGSVAAFLTGWFSKNLLLTITVGLIVFFIYKGFLG